MELAGQGERGGFLGHQPERGYAMAALLVGMSVMAILMSAALPVWSHMAKREKEEELIWRGGQYARAVGLFQRKYANTYPPTIDVLVEQRFLRKKYKDPVTHDDFQPIPAAQAAQPLGGGPGQTQRPGQTAPTGRGQPAQMSPTGQQGQGGFGQVAAPNIGVAGVVSKSKDSSIKIYNGRTKYNEWAFVYIQTTRQLSPTGGAPGMPGGRGQPTGRGPTTTVLRPDGTMETFPGMGGRGRPPVGQPPFGQPQFGQPPFGRPGQPGPFSPQPGTPQRPPTRPPGT